MAYLDDRTVKDRTRKIERMKPPYHKSFGAIVYGTECSKPWNVPLPLDHGINDMVSLDDLATDWWLKGGNLGGITGNNLADLSKSRFTITCIPTNPPVHLHNAYTVFRPELPLLTNILLATKFKYSGGWKGELLIVKHPGHDLTQITDVATEDEEIVHTVVDW